MAADDGLFLMVFFIQLDKCLLDCRDTLALRKFRDSLMELQRYSAEYAVQEAFAYAAWAISRSGDRLLSDRRKDILDVGKEYLARLRCIEGITGSEPQSGASVGKMKEEPHPEKYILAAKDLLPSEILQLPREELLGVILKEGSFDAIRVCGPGPMMKAVARLVSSWKQNERPHFCEVSLENKMACGLGVCLCCVEDTKDGHKCVCSDGPVFDIKDLKW